MSLQRLSLAKGRRTVHLQVSGWERKGPHLLVRFHGYEAPETARRWTGWEAVVPRENASPLRDGEVYLTDLVGCAVVYEDKSLGCVQGWYEGALQPLLEVLLEDGQKRLLPYLDRYIETVDLEARTLTLRCAWILE